MITIRPATIADAEWIARQNAALALESEERTLEFTRLLEGVSALLRDPAKGAYYVACWEGEPVGQLLLTYEWSDWRCGTFWWVQSVYVDPAHRGRGVFRSLFEHVRQAAGNQPDVCGLRLYVDRRNRRAKQAYQRLGLKPTEYELLEIDFVLGAAITANEPE